VAGPGVCSPGGAWGAEIGTVKLVLPAFSKLKVKL
jgi:hypothetical protein